MCFSSGGWCVGRSHGYQRTVLTALYHFAPSAGTWAWVVPGASPARSLFPSTLAFGWYGHSHRQLFRFTIVWPPESHAGLASTSPPSAYYRGGVERSHFSGATRKQIAVLINPIPCLLAGNRSAKIATYFIRIDTGSALHSGVDSVGPQTHRSFSISHLMVSSLCIQPRRLAFSNAAQDRCQPPLI